MSGNICWVHGPYPAGAFPDVKIFRRCMKEALLSGERVIADRGYSDDSCLTPNKSSESGHALAGELRARHEGVNGRLKTFAILRHRFYHNRSKHVLCFHAVAKVTQLTFEFNPMFFIAV